jgi:putative glutamine amidotransferase
VPKPLIAVSAYLLPPDRVRNWPEPAVALPSVYLEAVQRAGGQEALVMPRPLSPDDADQMLRSFAGLLLTGGPDVDPAEYGQAAHETVYGVVAERDAFELALARAAVRSRLPLLAVCRGHQVLNVALGGDLDQHITDRLPGHGIPGVGGGAELHEVVVDPDSQLAAVMGVDRSICSHHHHQVIGRLAEGLTVVARAADGTIEAVELADHPEVLSVQWHPEDTAAADPVQQRIFDAFVERARGSAA